MSTKQPFDCVKSKENVKTNLEVSNRQPWEWDFVLERTLHINDGVTVVVATIRHL